MDEEGGAFHFHRPKSSPPRLSLYTSFVAYEQDRLSRLSIANKSSKNRKKTKIDKEQLQKRIDDYDREWTRMQGHLDENANSMYDEIVHDIDQFVNISPVTNHLIPTAMVSFGACDDERFFVILSKQLVKRSFCVVRLRADFCVNVYKCIQHIISSLLSQLMPNRDTAHISTFRRFCIFYVNNFVESVKRSPKKKSKRNDDNGQLVDGTHSKRLVLIFENIESTAARFFDDLIAVIAASTLPFVFIFGLSTDIQLFRTRLSRQSYTSLAVRLFQFPSPSDHLNTLIRAMISDHEMAFRLDGKSMKLLTGRFLTENFSLSEFANNYRLALFEYFIAQPKNDETVEDLLEQMAVTPNLETLVDEPNNFRQLYSTTLDVLVYLADEAARSVPNSPVLDFQSLHCEIQKNRNFFTSSDGHYSYWMGIWSTWDQHEWISRLRRCIQISHKNHYLKSAVSDWKQFIDELENVEQRQQNIDAKLDRQIEIEQESKQSIWQMQTRMVRRIRDATKNNAFYDSKQRLLLNLRRLFESNLLQLDTLQLNNTLLFRYSDQFRMRSMALPVLSIEKSLMALEHNDGQLDSMHALSVLIDQDTARFSIDKWHDAFISSAQLQRRRSIDEQRARFFKAIGELELIGCCKAASQRHVSKVVKLYHTSEDYANFT